MITSLLGVTWGTPRNIIVIIPLLALFCAVLFYRIYRSKKAVGQLSSHRWIGHFLRNFSITRLYFKAFFLIMGTLFLLIVLLHPQWHKKEEIVTQHGRDLFIALDVSRSMLVRDCLPNRLECAKAKIRSLVKGLSSERVGLLIFSGTAFVQCPLTADYGAFFMFLDQVDVETIASGTTALDRVIGKVLSAYHEMESRKTKLLVIFTDGEDFSSNLHAVKKQAQDAQLHIFTIGVGTTQGAPIPMTDDRGKQVGHIKDNKGGVVISRLNESILYNVAQDSGGMYVQLTHDDADVNAMIKQVNSFEKEELGDKKFGTLQEQYPYFLLVSFICFILEWLL